MLLLRGHWGFVCQGPPSSPSLKSQLPQALNHRFCAVSEPTLQTGSLETLGTEGERGKHTQNNLQDFRQQSDRSPLWRITTQHSFCSSVCKWSMPTIVLWSYIWHSVYNNVPIWKQYTPAYKLQICHLFWSLHDNKYLFSETIKN